MNDTSINIKSSPQPNAYSYHRWSSALQTDGNSDERQSKITQAICDKFNLRLANTFKDRGVSAKDGANLVAEFSRLAKVVKPKEYVIVEDASRISRAGQYVGLTAIKELVSKDIIILIGRRLGTPILVNKDNWQDLEIWNALSSELNTAQVANTYATIGKREAWASKKEKVSKGEVVRYYKLPGWLSNSPKVPGQPPTYILDGEKVKAVNRVYQLYLKGYGCRRIAKMMNAEQWSPVVVLGKHKGKSWKTPTITLLIKDHRVLGNFVCRNQVSEHKLYPQIVNDELWSQVQTIRRSRGEKKFSGHIGNHINVFTGLCKCHLCGEALVSVWNYGTKRHSKGYKRQYFRCDNLQCTNSSGLRRDRLEFALKQVLCRMDLLKETLTKKEEDAPSILPRLEKSLEECIAKRKALYDTIQGLALRKLSTPDDIYVRIDESHKEEKEILDSIESEKERLKGTEPVKEALGAYNKLFKDKWDNEDSKYQIRELVRTAIEKIVCYSHEGRVRILFRNLPEKPIEILVKWDKCLINGVEFPYS